MDYRTPGEKAIYFDSSLCTGCKGCQAACKNWNMLPSPTGLNQNAPYFTGTYQNPPDLNNMTRLIMTFKEEEGGKKGIKWGFGRRSCQHCTDAPCANICPSGAIYIDEETKLVPIDQEKCIGCQYCSIACPFGVPRYYGAGAGAVATHTVINKCNGCIDRVRHNLTPACVKTCQPGALSFGDRAELLERGKARVEELKARGFEDAVLYGEDQIDGLHVIHVLKYGIEMHDQNPNPERNGMAIASEVMKPIVGIGSGVTVLGLAAMGILAWGYKRDKIGYNVETGDTLNLDTGELMKHGDGQDTMSVKDHIVTTVPIFKKHEAHEEVRKEERAEKKEERAERHNQKEVEKARKAEGKREGKEADDE